MGSLKRAGSCSCKSYAFAPLSFLLSKAELQKRSFCKSSEGEQGLMGPIAYRALALANRTGPVPNLRFGSLALRAHPPVGRVRARTHVTGPGLCQTFGLAILTRTLRSPARRAGACSPSVSTRVLVLRTSKASFRLSASRQWA